MLLYQSRTDQGDIEDQEWRSPIQYGMAGLVDSHGRLCSNHRECTFSVPVYTEESGKLTTNWATVDISITDAEVK